MQAVYIRAIRTRLRLHQTDLAQLLNVHPVTVSQWERGRAIPTPWHVALLQQFDTITDPQVGESARRYVASQGLVRGLFELLRHTDVAQKVEVA